MADKRATLDEVVAELHDGMTIGIGGWGSRRKPMALVRALLRAGASASVNTERVRTTERRRGGERRREEEREGERRREKERE